MNTPPILPRTARLVSLAVAAVTAACLDPLVDDQPGASANILPGGTTIPPITDDADLLAQITRNDGLDSSVLAASHNLIARGAGWSAGNQVRYWAFGAASRAPAPIYLFGTGDAGAGFVPLPVAEHLPLVDAVPGDERYNPIHAVFHVVVTDRYRGEQITTAAALADAVELGLVAEPVATKTFVTRPIVRPMTQLDVAGPPTGSTASILPSQLYARGHIVDSYLLGTAQPNPAGLLPTSHVSFLRAPSGASYDTTRPIFQAAIPTPPGNPSYTPLSVVVDVDLARDNADMIKSDEDLFTRTSGTITMVKDTVQRFTITQTLLVEQLQFTEGQP